MYRIQFLVFRSWGFFCCQIFLRDLTAAVIAAPVCPLPALYFCIVHLMTSLSKQMSDRTANDFQKLCDLRSKVSTTLRDVIEYSLIGKLRFSASVSVKLGQNSSANSIKNNWLSISVKKISIEIIFDSIFY